MSSVKICPCCGGEFRPRREAQKFCSVECANKSRAKSFTPAFQYVAAQRTCVICGNTFLGSHNAKYCGPECNREGQRRRAAAYKARQKRQHTAPLTLSEVAALANAAGMSYGHYVAVNEI